MAGGLEILIDDHLTIQNPYFYGSDYHEEQKVISQVPYSGVSFHRLCMLTPSSSSIGYF